MVLVLASGSETRRSLLAAAGLRFEVELPRVDEDAIRRALSDEGVKPRDVADALAEAKARKVGAKRPGDLVLGSDQVLDLGGRTLAKPETPDEARAQLRALSGQRHLLHAAIVAYDGAEPVWRFTGTVPLTMRELSPGYIDDYVTRNWDSVRQSVGAYKLEEEGMRLFRAVEGDYFTVLGMPMIPLLSWLTDRGYLAI